MLAMAATAVVSVAAVASAPGSGPSSPRGGTYRVGWEPGSFDGLDPTIDDFANAGIESNLLLRTLVGYDHVSGPAGTKLVPDLATAVPTPTNGGRTYTFTLKRGIRFGPPVDREITSNDVRFAIERLARPRNDAFFSALYPVYFAVVEGFTRYRAGHARSIPGIGTPNARTISFTLTRPVGDFLK